MTLIFLVSIFTVSYVSVSKGDLDLCNEGNLFSAMYFSISLLIGFPKYEYDAFCFSVFRSPISSVGLVNGILEEMILYFDFFYFFK